MLQWSLLFFIVALIAALVAFGGLAASAAVAKLFFCFPDVVGRFSHCFADPKRVKGAMLTIAATYASPNDAEWTRLKLQAQGIGPTGVELTVRASSAESQTRRTLERAGLSPSMAAHYARMVEGGETLLLAEVGTPALRETAELTIATYAQMPDLIGEIRETTTSAAKLAELRARVTRSPASRAPVKAARV